MTDFNTIQCTFPSKMSQKAMHEFGLNYISALKYSPFSASCYNNIIVNRNIPYRGIYFLCDTCTCIICVLAFWHNYKNVNFLLHPHRYHGKEHKHNKLFHTRFFIILKSATYRVQWDFACKATKFILLYIFIAQQKCRRHKIPLPHKAT